MKLLTRLSALCLVICLIYWIPGMALGAEYENYKTYNVSDQEKITFLQAISFSALDTETGEGSFSSFAVSEQGQIALCFNSQSAVISVYDSNGLYLYGFQFVNESSALAVFFEGETLSILWGKNRYIGSFDADGNCLTFQSYYNTKSNANSYHNDRYRPSTGQVGDMQYFAEKVGLSSNYAQLAVEDQSGNRTIIYDAVQEIRTRDTIVCSLVIIATTLVLITWWKHKKADEDNPSKSNS